LELCQKVNIGDLGRVEGGLEPLDLWLRTEKGQRVLMLKELKQRTSLEATAAKVIIRIDID